MVGVAIISTWVSSGISSVSMSKVTTWKFWLSIMSTKLAMLELESISLWPVAMASTGTSSMFTISRAEARALSTIE